MPSGCNSYRGPWQVLDTEHRRGEDSAVAMRSVWLGQLVRETSHAAPSPSSSLLLRLCLQQIHFNHAHSCRSIVRQRPQYCAHLRLPRGQHQALETVTDSKLIVPNRAVGQQLSGSYPVAANARCGTAQLSAQETMLRPAMQCAVCTIHKICICVSAP